MSRAPLHWDLSWIVVSVLRPDSLLRFLWIFRGQWPPWKNIVSSPKRSTKTSTIFKGYRPDLVSQAGFIEYQLCWQNLNQSRLSLHGQRRLLDLLTAKTKGCLSSLSPFFLYKQRISLSSNNKSTTTLGSNLGNMYTSFALSATHDKHSQKVWERNKKRSHMLLDKNPLTSEPIPRIICAISHNKRETQLLPE